VRTLQFHFDVREPAKGLEAQVHHLFSLSGWNDVISIYIHIHVHVHIHLQGPLVDRVPQTTLVGTLSWPLIIKRAAVSRAQSEGSAWGSQGFAKNIVALDPCLRYR
jgi:hypothetical protein